MKSSFFNSIIIFSIFSFIIILYLSIFIPIFIQENISIISDDEIIEFDYSLFDISGSSLLWPVPGYTKITSKFGYRQAPTSSASSYHSGIDIAAPVRFKYSFYF